MELNPNSNPMHTFDIDRIDPGTAYRLLVGSIVPRPIAWVSTRGKDGSTNLAPFSFFMGVSSKPLCLAFSVTPQASGTAKDTLKNILETRDFVVNLVNEPLAAIANQTSAPYPYGVSEIGKNGLTEIASVSVGAPRVKESPIHLECRLEKTVEIGEGGLGSSVIVVGRVIAAHVESRLLNLDEMNEGKPLEIDAATFAPVSRLGGAHWGHAPKTFTLERPKKP